MAGVGRWTKGLSPNSMQFPFVTCTDPVMFRPRFCFFRHHFRLLTVPTGIRLANSCTLLQGGHALSACRHHLESSSQWKSSSESRSHVAACVSACRIPSCISHEGGLSTTSLQTGRTTEEPSSGRLSCQMPAATYQRIGFVGQQRMSLYFYIVQVPASKLRAPDRRNRLAFSLVVCLPACHAHSRRADHFAPAASTFDEVCKDSQYPA